MTGGDHKPFDINRGGMLLGEAAAAVVWYDVRSALRTGESWLE